MGQLTRLIAIFCVGLFLGACSAPLETQSSRTPQIQVATTESPSVGQVPEVSQSPKLTPTSKVVDTPKVTPTLEFTQTPSVTLTPAVTKTPSVSPTPSPSSTRDPLGLRNLYPKKREKKPVPALQVLSSGNKWEAVLAPELIPPCVVKSTEPTHVRLGDRGTLTMAPDSQVSLGKDWATVKLMSGNIVVQAENEGVTIIDVGERKIKINEGVVMATSYPGRMEYRLLAGHGTVLDSMGNAVDYSWGTHDVLICNGVDSMMIGRSLGDSLVVFGVLTAFRLNPTELWGSHPAFQGIETPFGEVSLKLVNQVPSLNDSMLGRSRFRRKFKKVRPYRLDPGAKYRELEDRTLKWTPRKTAPKRVSSYLLKLEAESTGALIWVTSCEKQEAVIPDYVDLPPGQYRWGVFPVVGKEMKNTNSFGFFKIEEPKPAKES